MINGMTHRLPYVYGAPSATGRLRSIPEDFKVYENLPFIPSGEGEHVFLQIEKTGENTEAIARQLARFAEVSQRDIGYAGLKDRHAVTTQWFSVWLPGKPEPDWSAMETPFLKVLQNVRHSRKLKRGVLTGNRFQITIRDWQSDNNKLIEQLTSIKNDGIANYFGEQRFGHEGRNVEKALEMFKGVKVKREQRSIYLSAARSYLFNLILSERVAQGTWNKALAGDIFLFEGSQSCFKTDLPDADILSRIAAKAIHPSGVLWGKGDFDTAADAWAIEHQVIEQNKEISQGLIADGLEKSRRSLRVNVDDLTWSFVDQTTLLLTFSLPAGSYATALIRELIDDE